MELIDNSNSPGNKPGRSTTLTVLCVLSFIGSGLGILSGLYSLATAEMTKKSAEMYHQMLEKAEKGENPFVDSLSLDDQPLEKQGINPASKELLSGVGQMVDKAAKYAYELALAGLLGNLLCLMGVLFMWKLKRIGYFPYFAGQIITWVIPFVLLGGFGTLPAQLGNLVNVIYWVFSLFPLAFIVLYAFQLKNMK